MYYRETSQVPSNIEHTIPRNYYYLPFFLRKIVDVWAWVGEITLASDKLNFRLFLAHLVQGISVVFSRPSVRQSPSLYGLSRRFLSKVTMAPAFCTYSGNTISQMVKDKSKKSSLETVSISRLSAVWVYNLWLQIVVNEFSIYSSRNDDIREWVVQTILC